MPTAQGSVSFSHSTPGVTASFTVDGTSYTWTISIDVILRPFSCANATLTYHDAASLAAITRVAQGRIGPRDLELEFDNGDGITGSLDAPWAGGSADTGNRGGWGVQRAAGPNHPRPASGTRTAKGTVADGVAAFTVGRRAHAWAIAVDVIMRPFTVSAATLAYTDATPFDAVRRVTKGRVGPRDIELVFDNGAVVTGELDTPWAGGSADTGDRGGWLVTETSKTPGPTSGMRTAKGSVVDGVAAFTIDGRAYAWAIAVDVIAAPFKVSAAMLTYTDATDLAAVHRVTKGRVGPSDLELVFDNGAVVTGALDMAWLSGSANTGNRGGWLVSEVAKPSKLESGTRTAQGTIADGVAAFTVGGRAYAWAIAVDVTMRPFRVSSATLTYKDNTDFSAVRKAVKGRIGPKDVEIELDNGAVITGNLDKPWENGSVDTGNRGGWDVREEAQAEGAGPPSQGSPAKGTVEFGYKPVTATFPIGGRVHSWTIAVDVIMMPFNVSDAALTYKDGADFTAIRKVVKGRIGPKDLELELENGAVITGTFDKAWSSTVSVDTADRGGWQVQGDTAAESSSTSGVATGSVLGDEPGPVLAAFTVGDSLHTWSISIYQVMAPFKVSYATAKYKNLADLNTVKSVSKGRIGPRDVEIAFDNGVVVTGDLDDAWHGGSVTTEQAGSDGWEVAVVTE
ncbi:hypothetical protein PsYK624_121630 [Phanerochaete sordida]|uniref:Uncharacterized protein n=1 Tax=Phanerochaete sordida TaxID=48140 RepID=A0A9P3GM15_9APHY|nr:hypothetical protein PsYK624_121630 [Phanerochaete sordida]